MREISIHVEDPKDEIPEDDSDYFDPYEILGVGIDFTIDELRKAYRAKSKVCHPDVKGGSKKAFERLSLAFAILSDPDRRAEYDANGTLGETAVVKNPYKVFGDMVDTFVEKSIMSTDFDPKYIDFKKYLLRFFADALEEAATNIEEARRVLKRLVEVKKRTKKKGKQYHPVLEKVFIDRITEVRRDVSHHTEIYEGLMFGIEIMHEYEYEVDKMDALANVREIWRGKDEFNY